MRGRCAAYAAYAAFAAVCVAVPAASGCAKAYAPPGGTQDRTPPRLVSTTPAALEVVPALDGPIVFTFDETLAEQGISNATVVVSPQPAGNVEIERHGNRIEVKSEAGWERDQIYRVIIRPGVGDRFGNRRTDAVEIVFSTGPAIESTAFAGLVTDRLTGRAAPDAAIEAVRTADSAVYTTNADSAGFFALRSVPAGAYMARAYFDSNRNRRRDPSEAHSTLRPVGLSATDTVTTEFVLLPADTTGPLVTRAEAMDSLHVKVGFDDYIDPDTGLQEPTLQVERLADSTSAGGPVAFTAVVLSNRYRPPPPTLPTPAPDTARAPGDTIARRPAARAPGDTIARRPAAQARVLQPPGVQPEPQDTTALPDREVVITLAANLAPGAKYRVTMTNVRNVNGLAGGGSAEFDARPPR